MGTKIQIIEDSSTVTRILEARLESAGYTVFKAADGETGLSLMREAKPDLVLLDILLPDIDGFEVARRAKADPGLKNIPIIAVTTQTKPEDKELGRKVGIEGYITKPYEWTELKAEIDRLLKKARDRD